MTKLVSRATRGRVGLVVEVIALMASVSGAAVGLPGKNKVDGGDIKNNTVTVSDLKIAYLRTDGNTGAIVQSKGIKNFFYPIGNTLCLDLKFVPKTGSATRTIDSGGDFTAPQSRSREGLGL